MQKYYRSDDISIINSVISQVGFILKKGEIVSVDIFFSKTFQSLSTVSSIILLFSREKNVKVNQEPLKLSNLWRRKGIKTKYIIYFSCYQGIYWTSSFYGVVPWNDFQFIYTSLKTGVILSCWRRVVFPIALFQLVNVWTGSSKGIGFIVLCCVLITAVDMLSIQIFYLLEELISL